MEGGMERSSAEQIKEMVECPPSVDSRLNEVNSRVQDLNLSIGTIGNNIEMLLRGTEKLTRRLEEKDGNKPQISSSTTQAGVVGMLQDVSSVQYKMEIENFSVLQRSKLEKYESNLFDAYDHKWRLSLYPNGNTKRGGEGYLSLYLEIAETETLPVGWEVHINMKMLVYDHNQDKYLAFQDAIGSIKRFHRLKTEWGLAKLIRLDTFNDASNGFLIEDSCVIGVELFLVLDTAKGESISLVKDLKQNTHTWRIDGFSETRDEKLWSEEFVVGGPGGDYIWFICLYPNGAHNAKGKFISLYLYLGAYSKVPEGGKVYAEYKLRIKNPKGKQHYVKEGRYWFTCQKYSEGEKSEAFIDYPSLKSDFLFNDSLIVEAEIMTVCLIKGLN